MKGTITMSSKEANRITILDKLIHKEMKQKKAAEILKLSVRQIRRIVKAYKRNGATAIVHKLRGLPGNNQIDPKVIDSAISIVKQKYSDFTVSLAYEKLTEHHQFTFSRETLRQALIDKGLIHCKHRKMITIHQMRERRSYEGELVLVDGSPHSWFENRGSKCTLLVFIDDATSKLLHLEFVPSESTNSYFLAVRHYLSNCGKPLAFYLDKHGVFRVNTSHRGSGAVDDVNGKTQFGRAMEELGIELIYANSPEAKGRVERANQTLQDRLVKEMRLQGISTMEEANSYLPRFIIDFNQRFSVAPKQIGNVHRPLLASDNLDQILIQKYQRRLSKQLSFHYDNKLYQIKINKPSYTLRYANVIVHEDNLGEVLVYYRNQKLDYQILEIQPKAYIADSKTINLIVDNIKKQIPKTKIRGSFKPGISRPWRKPYSVNFQNPAFI